MNYVRGRPRCVRMGSVSLKIALYKRLKTRCSELDITISAAVAEAVTVWLDGRKKGVVDHEQTQAEHVHFKHSRESEGSST